MLDHQELPPTNSYCLWCAKVGHYSHECHSTHGLNTPAARELDRLIEAGRQQGMKQERALWQLAHEGQMIDLRQALESKLWRGTTYTERDLEMFALGVRLAQHLL